MRNFQSVNSFTLGFFEKFFEIPSREKSEKNNSISHKVNHESMKGIICSKFRVFLYAIIRMVKTTALCFFRNSCAGVTNCAISLLLEFASWK